MIRLLLLAGLLGLASYANAEGVYDVGVSWTLSEDSLTDCNDDEMNNLVVEALHYVGIEMSHDGWDDLISEDALNGRYAHWKKEYAKFKDAKKRFDDKPNIDDENWNVVMKEYYNLKKAVVDLTRKDVDRKKQAGKNAMAKFDGIKRRARKKIREARKEAREAEEEAEKAQREADLEAKEAAKLAKEAGMSDEADEACDTTEEFECADGSVVTRDLDSCLFPDCPTFPDDAIDPSPTDATNDGEGERALAEEELDFSEHEVDQPGESHRRLGGCKAPSRMCQLVGHVHCVNCCGCGGRRRRGLRQQEREMLKVYSGEDIEMTAKLVWTAITAMMEKYEDDEEHNQHNRIECLKYPVEVVVKMGGERGNIHTVGPESPVEST
ncbi:expressed unknown protein [Seminavis robusta]|uniref:Uncharacterized protein n=1 Tax=Seminavis robusta TaxID=568900 RepID=A0A9N8HPV8_9STRA|nr:expressed unknown protein [Seminavis robusta]|eukprot:Sro1366_g266670.1 n/a (381) ;mRNA; f:17266-18408